MIIGVPKEILENENRVAVLPDVVAKYVKLGFEVHVEASAGQGSFHADEEYVKAGAVICRDVSQLFAESDIIIKVKQPCFNKAVGKSEEHMLREGSILISFLHPAAPTNHQMIKVLRDRNITSFTMDSIPRSPRAQKMDALTSMSTITGYKAVMLAANHFPKFIPMIGTAIGTTTPAKVLVIGAGVVGLQAIATAKRIGAVVTAVDIREDARREAGTLKANVVGFEVAREFAVGDGGYAKALPDKLLEKEREFLRPLAAESDIIILSALVPGEIAPVLITAEMVAAMKAGSVIIDVSVDQGGNCALTESGHETMKGGVYLCGKANIPGAMPVHASWLYSNNMYYYVENLFKKGLDTLDLDDEIVEYSLVTHKGKIVHQGTLKAMKEA